MEKIQNFLLYGAGDTMPDIRYASGFSAPDAFLFFQCGAKKICVVSPLEYNRAKSSVAPGVEVRRIEESEEEKKRTGEESVKEQIRKLCAEFAVTEFAVPREFPFGLAKALQAMGLNPIPAEKSLLPERMFKSSAEVEKIKCSLRAAEAGCRRAFEVLREAEIDSGRNLRWNGAFLTSELLRAEIDCTMLRAGMLPADTICAGGLQGAQPHNAGSGVLKADYPIVMDIFPKSATTGYWGDLTRTVVKGTPSDWAKRAYETVYEARELGKSLIRIGADTGEIHNAAAKFMEQRGFPTGCNEEGDFGFFHSLGHGVGLDIHELPRLSPRKPVKLQGGEVVTIEPGLYYPQHGGIRLEDMVYLNPDGKAEILTEIEDFFMI